MYNRLLQICVDANADPDIRVMVIRGSAGNFAAGTDISEFSDFTTGQHGIDYERKVAHVLSTIRAVRVPVIAAVQGAAVGGGLALAACCDLVIATPEARFGVPVAQTLGNVISPATLQLLRLRLGPSRTTAMLVTSTLMTAAEVHAAGMIHAVIDQDSFETHLTDTVNRIAKAAPRTLSAIKEITRRLDKFDDLDAAEDVIASIYGSADFREGVNAFMNRRPPVWSGR
jgi:enoyl-CoA hydratase/carnithine racemase